MMCSNEVQAVIDAGYCGRLPDSNIYIAAWRVVRGRDRCAEMVIVNLEAE